MKYDKKKYPIINEFECGCKVAFTKDKSEGFAIKICEKDKE